MKTIILGAAGLLLSGTAMAGVVTSKSMAGQTAMPVAAKAADTLGTSVIGNAMLIDWPAKAADQDKAMDRAKATGTGGQTMPETPAAETPSTSVMSDSAATDAMSGVGGPDEPVDAPAVRAFSANDYPPCTSRSDDNCIQLSEPGVRESLAAFQASHGLDQTGMGGPEEPVDDTPLTAAATQGDELAAYEPLPEDAVMPASEDHIEKDSPDTMAI